MALGITSGALSQWTQVPADRAIAVEEWTGISRHMLRPDVFGIISIPPKFGAAPARKEETSA